MDNHTLLAHLSNTLSPDNSVRKQSESLLLNQNVQILPQILSLLLNDNSIPPQIQLVCLTLIKNRITLDWNSPNTNDDIKNTIKNQIVQFIVNFPNPFSGPNHSIVRMSLKIINIIIFFGSKEFQFDLLNYANTLISKDVDNFYIGVLFILQVSKYNRNTDNYELLDNISLNFCPVFNDFLHSYNKELENGDVNSIEKKLITHDILKILNYLTTTRIPKYFHDTIGNKLQNFCNLFVDLFFNLIKNEDYENAKWILRFFIKLQIKSKSTSYYQAEFINIFTNSILQSNISSIMQYLSNSYETITSLINIDDDNTKERNLYYLLVYITKCLAPLTFKCIEPHLNMIISNIIVRTFSISSEEIDNFTDDSADFINNNLSITFSVMFYDISNSDIKYASSLFIKKLIDSSNNFINPLVSLASQILSTDQEDKSSISCSLDILKIVESNIDQETLNSAINRIIEINRNLSNNELWLRCLIFEFFSNLNTKDINLFNHLQVNLSLSLESSQPLPILISTLKLIILKLNSSNIHPIQIMQILLTINESEHLEIVNNLIDLLAEKYPQQLIPYSSQLITSLCNSFLHIQDDENNNEFDDGSKENKLLAIIDNILTILQSINEPKNIIEINEQLNYIISSILDNAMLDLVESIMELVEQIIIQSKKVLNLEVVINSFKNYGFDYFNYYSKFFESIYCYGNEKEKNIINELMKWIIDENPAEIEINEDEFEFIEFLSSIISEMVISSTLEKYNDNGLSDEVYNKSLRLLYNAYQDKEEFWTNKMIFRCIIGGFINKPSVILNVFNNDNLIEEILTRFDNLINDGIWCTVYDLKLGIVGTLSIIKVSSDNLNIKSISMTVCHKLCDKMNDAIEHRDKLKSMCGSISNGEDLGEDGEFGLNCDDDEYDELDKVSVLDSIDVFGQVKNFLNNGQ